MEFALKETTMNVFEQYKNKLSAMEIEDSLKESLTKMFSEVENVHSEIKDRLTTKTDENKGLKEKLDSISKEFDLDQDFKLDELSAKMNNKSKLDELRIEMSEKHDKELSELRGLLDIEKDSKSKYEVQLNDMLFENAITKEGLLNGFIDDPKMRGLVSQELKSKLLFEDGKVFVRGEDGKPAKDITTGKHLEPKDITNAMLKSSEWAGFVSPQTNGNGSGMPNNQNSNNQGGGLNRSKMSHQEKGEYIKENGQEAYLKLPN